MPLMSTTPHPLRSLPFHLTLQMLLWNSSNAALHPLRPASPSLSAKWPNSGADALRSAVNHELARRNANLLNGIHRYLTHPYQRRESKADVIWQRGNCRLLDFGVEGKERARVLFIPSLINRYYILDLKDERSMVIYLRRQGIRPLVMDWGNPSGEEESFSCTEYVTQRLLSALETAQELSHSPLIAAGYCMGGLLALALAQLAQSSISGLALLATPWNFHAYDFPRVSLDSIHAQKLEEILARQTILSGDTIQTLFYASNPWLFARKFATFGKLASDSAEAEDFVAIEGWVNDNVDMSSSVARECLIDWVQKNYPARGLWQVAGENVTPHQLDLPIFAACPAHDTIVPPDCAEPLLPLLRQPTIIRPASGHVGMVAGVNARMELWQPFRDWLFTR